MTSGNQHEYEELSLTSVAGLQTVFRNVQALYQQGIAVEAELLISSEAGVAITFHSTYKTVRATIERLITTVQSGGALSAADASGLQATYDSFVSAQGALRRFQAPASSATKPLRNEETSVPITTATRASAPAPAPVSPPVTRESVTPGPEFVPASVERTIPVRTSVKLPVSQVEQLSVPSDEPRKKKRRRKKKSQRPDGVVPLSDTSTASQFDAIQLMEDRAKLVYEEIKSDQRVMQHDEVVEAAQVLLVELTAIIREAKALAVVSETQPYAKEKLLHYRTLAEATLVELRALKEQSRIIHHASLGKEHTTSRAGVSIPTNTAVVVAPESENDVVLPRISFVPSTITAGKSKPTIARAVPKELVSLTRPDPIHTPFSLTATYLTAGRYQSHIATHYSSNESFERLLDASVTTLEARTIDGLERWLGDTPASAFHFIKDMSLQAFQNLASQPYEVVTERLRAENIKYETFLVWRDLFEEMVQVVTLPQSAPYGQLFATFMIEEDIASLLDE